ncbi:uncharacterized protein LOC120354003 isoform X2 [Nilaparvata lugens]|uniref:uncharacterized protein LOC120354003 isoform X2 n=1 Tax=Nilaparvata lugens TaxID=108931 RepID=UPI00193CC334|nr:uncharacterized protein LOC120354003 isoform X2 [Nilaparvata lugens]
MNPGTYSILKNISVIMWSDPFTKEGRRQILTFYNILQAHRRLAYDGERLLKAVTLIGIISIKPSNPALKSKCDTIQME